MTLDWPWPILRQGQIWLPVRLNWKNCYKVIRWEKLAANDQINRRFIFWKKFWPQGVVCPCPRAIYMYVTIVFKHIFLLNPLANQSQILYGAPFGRGNLNFVKIVLVTWPRWPPCPYMVKTFKNLLLQNHTSYDLATWHAASGTQALQNLYKWWPWVDLDLFYGKVKFGRLYVWKGKSVTKSSNGKTCSKGLNWLNNCVNEKKLTPGGCLPLPRGHIHVYDHHFQRSSSLKPLGQSKPNFIWSLLGKG